MQDLVDEFSRRFSHGGHRFQISLCKRRSWGPFFPLFLGGYRKYQLPCPNCSCEQAVTYSLTKKWGTPSMAANCASLIPFLRDWWIIVILPSSHTSVKKAEWQVCFWVLGQNRRDLIWLNHVFESYALRNSNYYNPYWCRCIWKYLRMLNFVDSLKWSAFCPIGPYL